MRVLVFPEARLTLGRLSLLFLCAGVPLVFSTRLEDGFELPQILGAVVAASFLLLMCRGRDWAATLKAHWFIFVCFLIFFGAGIYSFAGLAREVSFYFPTENYLWILTAALFLAPVGSFLEKRKLYSFMVFSGVLGSFYSFAQFLGLGGAGWNTQFGGRSFSTLGNPTFWAGHLLVLFPLAVYLAGSARRKGMTWFWLGAAGILTASLLITQTRGAWLGFLGEVVFLAVLNRGKSHVWKRLMLGLIVFLLVLLVVPSLNQRAVSLFQTRGQDAQGRYFLWKAAVNQWKEKKWMGQGPGGYANQFGRTQSLLSQAEPLRPYWTAAHAHEEYLELLDERGLVGAFFAFLVLWILARRRFKNINAFDFSTEKAELAVLWGIGIHSLFHFPFSIVPTACAMALLFNPSWDMDWVRSSPEDPLWNEFRFFLGVGLFLLCGLGMGVCSQNARLHQSIDLAGAQRYEEALALLNGDPSLPIFNYLDPRILKQKATLLATLGREPEAVPLWEGIVKAYPYDADAYAALCMLYGKQENWERARINGERALEICPSHEQALNNLAMVAYLEGHEGEAVSFLQKLEEAQISWGQEAGAGETGKKIKLLENETKPGLPTRIPAK